MNYSPEGIGMNYQTTKKDYPLPKEQVLPLPLKVKRARGKYPLPVEQIGGLPPLPKKSLKTIEKK